MMLPPSVRVYVATSPCDLRKHFDGIALVVEHSLRLDPRSGHLYVVFNRRGDQVRILFWDRNGWALYSKRLEVGNFHLPVHVPEGTQRVEVDAAELMLMLEGIDLRGAKRYARWRPPNAENDEHQGVAKS